jgi:antitoxin component of RelBE/YafQ-DinJ toxin-antitoxin module
MPMSDLEGKIISLRIFMPEFLRNEFKAVCARQGRNMSEVVTDFVRSYVAKHGVLPPTTDRTEDSLTETKTPLATKAKRSKASKEAS